MVKELLLFLSFFLASFFGVAQAITDLGKKTYSQIKASQSIPPCDDTYAVALTYCDRVGDRITYIFEDHILSGILFQTAFISKTEAERQLKIEVRDFAARNSMEPTYGNGQVFFYKPYSNLTVSYGVKDYEGTWYLLHYTFLAN
jgi:hypothetical protein